MNCLVNDTGILGKREPEFAHRSPTYDLPITSSVLNVRIEVKLEGFVWSYAEHNSANISFPNCKKRC